MALAMVGAGARRWYQGHSVAAVAGPLAEIIYALHTDVGGCAADDHVPTPKSLA